MAFEHIVRCDDPALLPLARSRIAAIRASGLMYGSQTFKSGGSTVTVRVKGEASYIQVEGGGSVLSGMVRNGDIIEVAGPTPDDPPIKVMHEFKPTVECGEFVLGKKPSEFMDIKRLATGEVGTKAYVTTVKASMYSGEMTKVVQVLLGYGKTASEKRGREVKYKHNWAECHGVVRGADGTAWLVYISAAVGVIAMVLPIETAMTMDIRQKVIAETKALFGGVPSGRDFPKDAKLTAKIDAGTILRLLEPTDQTLIDYFGCQPYNVNMGWSFNNDGSEAHNVCWKSDEGDPYPYTTNVVRGHHYKIDFTIGPLKDKATLDPNEPIADASAVLTKVHSGLYIPGYLRYGLGEVYVPAFARPLNFILSNGLAKLFVCHIGGQLVVISLRNELITDDFSENSHLAYGVEDGVHTSRLHYSYGFTYWKLNGGITYTGTKSWRSADGTNKSGAGSTALVYPDVRDMYHWYEGGALWVQLRLNQWFFHQPDLSPPSGDLTPGSITETTYPAGSDYLIFPNGQQATMVSDPRSTNAVDCIRSGSGTYFDALLNRYEFGPYEPYFPITYADLGVVHYSYPQFVLPRGTPEHLAEVDAALGGGLFVRVGPMFSDVENVATDTCSFIGYVE